MQLVQPVKRCSTMIDDHRCGAHTWIQPLSLKADLGFLFCSADYRKLSTNTHFARRDPGLARLRFILKMLNRVMFAISVYWHQRDATFPLSSLSSCTFGAKSRLSCKANEAKILTFLWNFPEVKLNCWAPWCNLLCLLFSRYQIPDIPSNTCCQATFSLKVKSPQKDFESKVLIVLASFPAIPGYCPDYKIHLYWRKSVFRVTFQADAHADPISPQHWWVLRGRMSNLYSEHVQRLEWPGPGEGLLSLPSTTWQAAEHLVRMLFYYITLESQWIARRLFGENYKNPPWDECTTEIMEEFKEVPPHTSSAIHDRTASEDPHALHAFSSIHEWHIHPSLSSRY